MSAEDGSFAVEPVVLSGQHVELEPLSLLHAADLSEAVEDGELWLLPYASAPSSAGLRREIERQLDLQRAGLMLPFTFARRPWGRLSAWPRM